MPHIFCLAQQGLSSSLLFQLLFPLIFLPQGSLQGEETNLRCMPDDGGIRSASPIMAVMHGPRITYHGFRVQK